MLGAVHGRQASWFGTSCQCAACRLARHRPAAPCSACECVALFVRRLHQCGGLRCHPFAAHYQAFQSLPERCRSDTASMAGPAAADAQGSVGSESAATGDHTSPFAAAGAQDSTPDQATAEQSRSAARQAPAEHQFSSDSGRGGGEPSRGSSGQHQVSGNGVPVPASPAAGRNMAAGSPGAGHTSARRGQVCCPHSSCSA